MKLTLGKLYKDKITGFKGIAMSRVEYITGCTQYCIQPQGLDKNGVPKSGLYYDEDRLEEVGRGVMIKNVTDGGPSFEGVPPRQYPERR